MTLSSAIGAILTNIRQTLRGTGAFAAVTVGPDTDSACWPRAEVGPISVDHARADDTPNDQWCALKTEVRLHVRSTGQGEALSRALELAESTQEAILTDRFRGQQCRDLPIGKATELGPIRLDPAVRAPYVCAAFEVLCHFEP